MRVVVEVGPRRCFASALDWPGWCRSGRGADAALETLAAYTPRYAVVAAEAGARFPGAAAGLEVVESLAGGGGTDFGIPEAAAAAEAQPLSAAAARRLVSLLRACWAVFDGVVVGAPEKLRKGPRGGGRDRDAVVAHVVEAEVAYARRMGLRPAPVDPGDPGSVASLRQAISEALAAARAGEPMKVKGWLPRYAARRIAWHVLDHAWEIEDRSW
jgi:hypothetical protein